MRLMLIALTQWCRTEEKSICLSPYKTDLMHIHNLQSELVLNKILPICQKYF